jgi:hypothetical protein
MDFKEQVIFKTSSADRQALQQKANEMRLTLSGYIRYKLFNNGSL